MAAGLRSLARLALTGVGMVNSMRMRVRVMSATSAGRMASVLPAHRPMRREAGTGD
jgi:hypothetical protein